MATRSIYNNVNIKDKSLSRALVSALESAQKKNQKMWCCKSNALN